MKAKMFGAKKMMSTLKRISEKYPDVVAAAMYQEAQIEMTESKRRCPVGDTGNLRASGTVHKPTRSGRVISVTMSYGGLAEDYAIVQHERLDYFHRVGEAKFLESVLNESQPWMGSRIAQRISFNNPEVIRSLGGEVKMGPDTVEE